MKVLQFLTFLFFLTIEANAQQNHFIYIQTEQKQPFYVKLGDRVLSSSATGYLVISKMAEGNYELNIGFPKNEYPVQKIIVVVKNKDEGYTLKNFDSKGWGLFNMQTMEVIMAKSDGPNANSINETGSDKFADVLADVVSTPSIKQKSAPKEVLITKMPEKEIVKEVSVIKEEKPIPELVRPTVKLFSTIDTSGRTLVYIDTYENKADTIRIFIPYKQLVEVKETVIEKPIQAIEIVKATEKKPEVKPETKFLDIELPNPNSKVDSAVNALVDVSNKKVVKNESAAVNKEEVIKKENQAVIMINSDCKLSANDDDFLKLRKKMAAEKNDDDMISVAKKSFRSKCFSTDMISNLSVLFLKDEGKYNFFDAAYPRVSDTQNFSGLVSKLSDEYYITRFKAMIRH